jgi:hypothetical protein
MVVEYSLRSVDLCFDIGASSIESNICKAVLMEMHLTGTSDLGPNGRLSDIPSPLYARNLLGINTELISKLVFVFMTNKHIICGIS